MIKFNNVDFTYQNAQNGAGVHNITLSIPQGRLFFYVEVLDVGRLL